MADRNETRDESNEELKCDTSTDISLKDDLVKIKTSKVPSSTETEINISLNYISEDNLAFTFIQGRSLSEMKINDEEHTNICRYLSDLTNTSDGMSYTIVPDGQKLSSHNFSETSAKDFHYKGSSSKDFQKRHSTYKLNCQYFTTMKINETGEELRSLRSFKTIPECIEYLLKDKFSLLDRAVRGIEVQLDQEDVGDFFSSSTLAMLAI